MKIDTLELTNFKNFSKLKVSFAAGVNLFVGGNGSGKTALLEAINVAIGCFFGSQEQKIQRFIELDEIKITDGKRAEATSVFAQSNGMQWSRTIKRDTNRNDSIGARSISDYGSLFFHCFEIPTDRTIAPIFAYYSTQRLFKDAYLSGKQKYDAAVGRKNGYLQCLAENSIKAVLREWLGNAVTKRATFQIKEIKHIDLVLENVEKAIRKTLILFFELPESFSLKIYQDPDFDNDIFVNYDNEHNLPLNYYSDGFRNLLYLIIDLVWRASQLNPWLTLDQISESVSGVVTLDEIDLHLHPKWQAKAVGVIQSLLPNVQFFITTHSPTVVANFQNGSLYVVSDNKVEKLSTSFFGKQINIVLTTILGASDRHVPTQQKLDMLFRLIDDNKVEEYEPLLAELTTLLGNDDADINKALVLIEWQNSINIEG